MKISLDWLSDFIDITEKDSQKINDIITERSAEVETMESQGADLDKVVVGKITELGKHPNADSLMLCKVNDGNEDIQVVCGGSNLKEGMLVAFAQLGAVVKWHGTDVVTMEKAKIRGEESFGMICAAEEVGLADMFPKQTEKEIVDLTHLNLEVGMPLAKALQLDDVVMDVDNHAITNRSDLFSHRGFAREFVANQLGAWKNPKDYPLPENNSPAPVSITFQDKELCKRYVGVYLTGMEVKESPEWMKKRLTACGVNTISNMVDITNYVMLELGMPLHAFDVDRVSNKEWTMRKAKKGERLVTLDEKEHELPEGAIVLDDGSALIDLCGVMGGLTSSIESRTKNVWLIAPVYHPTHVRRGMRALGHVSDAGIIYEKGVDPALASDGLARAIELIQELCPGVKIASQVMDVWNVEQEEREITLSVQQLNRLVGVDIPEKEALSILEHLGFTVETQNLASGPGYKVVVPSFRLNDVHHEADVIEEVARIYGFNNIPDILPVEPIEPITPLKHRVVEREMKEKLTSFGYNEIYTFAFLGPELLKKTGMEVTDEMVEVTNPISSDMSLMRTSLVPRLLETVEANLRYNNAFALFELNTTYHRQSDTGHEERSALVMAEVGGNLRQLQGVVEALGFKILPLRGKDKNPLHHPGRVGEVVVRGKVIGHVFEVHPQVLKQFDIKAMVNVCQIDVSLLSEIGIETRPKYKEINRFPSVQLDISLLIDQKELAGEYLNTIEKTDKKLITQVDLIDEYVGDKIPENKRALTYSITYQASDRTLTDKVLERVQKKGAEVRG